MKKVFLALAVVGLIGFASCSKEKKCHCYYDYVVPVIGTNTTQDLGTYQVTDGSCTDFQNQNTDWNFNFGDLGQGTVRCERE